MWRRSCLHFAKLRKHSLQVGIPATECSTVSKVHLVLSGLGCEEWCRARWMRSAWADTSSLEQCGHGCVSASA